jgi:hypothetical protein
MAQQVRYTHPAVVALRSEWVASHGPAAILSAIGHPGYGAAFARSVLGRMERTGECAHMAVAREQAAYNAAGR